MRSRDFRRRRCVGVIDFQLIRTWPPGVLRLLTTNLGELRSYERRQARIDALCERDVFARLDPPQNEFRLRRGQIVEEVDRALAGERVLGFHCTRLLPNEMDEIRTGGLLPLTVSLVVHRIRRACSMGMLPGAVARVLERDNQAADRGRENMCWFVNRRSDLTEESAVKR
jgi:hypothetical protein